jgi:Flp pilus assembly protein TadD
MILLDKLHERKQRRAATKQPHTSGPARPQFVDEGLRHHQAGRLDRAKALYLKALALQPNDADALHLLGVLRHQQGSSLEAVELVTKANAVKPNIADWHSNLGIASRRLAGSTRRWRAATARSPCGGTMPRRSSIAASSFKS